MPPNERRCRETPLRHVHKPLPHDSARQARAGRAPTTSTTCASRRARCISRSAARRVARGTICGARSRRGAQRAGRRRGAHRGRHSGQKRRRARRSPTSRSSPRTTSSSTARPCSPSLPSTRDAARRAARLAQDRDRSRSARSSPSSEALGVRRDAFCRTTPSAAATRPRRSPPRRIAARRHACASAARSISISKARSRSPSRARTATSLVYSSTQHPTEVQHIVARVLGAAGLRSSPSSAPHGRRLRRQGKPGAPWAAIAALAARVTGRPCKLRLDRDDDMVMTGKRHDFRVDYARRLRRRRAHPRPSTSTLDARCGCSADLSPRRRRPRHVPCRQRLFPARRRASHSRRLKTNTVSNTAFRGFGGPQGMMAIERVIDAIALRARARSARRAQGQSLRRRPRRHALRHDGRGQRHRAAIDRRAGAHRRDYRARRAGDRGLQRRERRS